MAERGITVRIRIEGIRETLGKFRDLPKDASNELRDASLKISKVMASAIAAAAASSSPQSALVASTVKAVRDRAPAVQAGSSKRVGRNRKPAHKVLFGANFGATYLPQFRPHRGAGDDDYWFFSTVERHEAAIGQAWNQAADTVLRKWGAGG